jgi:hypothetical protein
VTRDRSAIFSDHVTTRVVYDGAHLTVTVVIETRCLVSESRISSSDATPDLAYREESGGRDLRIP